MRILVFVGNGIGNCIETTPLILSLKDLGYVVDILVRSYNTLASELFEGLGDIYKPNDKIDVHKYKFGIITWGMAPTPNARGMTFLNIKIPPAEEISEVEYNMAFARHLGYKKETPNLYCQIRQELTDTKKYITINGLSRTEFKTWENWKWKELIEYIKNNYNFELINIKDKYNSLKPIMNYIKHSIFTITTEGGFGWMSLAINVPTIILAGVTIGGRWKDRTYNKKNIYKSKNVIYITKKDIKDITVEDVINKVLELINKVDYRS